MDSDSRALSRDETVSDDADSLTDEERATAATRAVEQVATALEQRD